MKDPELEIYRDRDGEWRWCLRQNEHVLADGGGSHKTKAMAVKSARRTMEALVICLA